ncbi:MAG: hypothetical protein AB1757_23095 [Acidobacteriota bacterium]
MMNSHMTPQRLRHHFSGVMAFPVTLFKNDLSLDLAGIGGADTYCFD